MKAGWSRLAGVALATLLGISIAPLPAVAEQGVRNAVPDVRVEPVEDPVERVDVQADPDVSETAPPEAVEENLSEPQVADGGVESSTEDSVQNHITPESAATPVAPQGRPPLPSGPSGVEWAWDPSDSVPWLAVQWGFEGAHAGLRQFNLHWFVNNMDEPIVLTKITVRETTGKGKLDLSWCKLPMRVPPKGYAVCESNYAFSRQDPQFIDTTLLFWGDEDGPLKSRLSFASPDPKEFDRPAPGPFWDVPSDHKFVKPITWMQVKKLSTGYADGSYRPQEPLSREAMAAFLYRQAGKPKFTMPRTGFSDVRPGHKFYREIMWMKASKLSTGYADGAYRPGERLSREAMAAFMYRAKQKPRFTSRGTFRDVPAGAKFYREIAWMKAAGITTGNADGTFRPRDPVTREAMAAFLYRQAGSPKL